MERSDDTIALERFDRALDLIACESKAAYLEVAKCSPHLIEKESNPRKYLVSNDGAADVAAKKLVTYWEQRKAIFGERAFLPIDATGRGALTVEDIEWMKTGVFIALPEKDAAGRTVVCTDRARVGSSMAIAHLVMRVVFYMMTVAAENERSQTAGVVFLTRMTENLAPHKHQRNGVLDLIRAMPVRVHSIHLACCPPKASRRVFQDVIIPMTIKVYDCYVAPHAHVGDDKEDLLAKLQVHGLTRTQLPYNLGGSWDYVDFDDWMSNRISKENTKYKKSPVATESPSVTDTKNSISETANSTPDTCDITRESGAGSGPSNSEMGDRSGCDVASVTPKSRGVRNDEGTGPMAEFQKAIDLLPADTKAAYLGAVEGAPGLLKTESGARRFLLCNNMNAEAAAKHLVHYWEGRNSIFGARTYLPLDCSGRGAMASSDVEGLKHATFIVLPKKDSSGRTVVSIDCSKVQNPGSFPMQCRLRIAFYMLNVAAENEKSQTEGVVFIVRLTEMSGGHNVMRDGVFQWMRTVMPIRIHSVHFACQPHAESRRFLDVIVPMALKCAQNCKTHIHVGKDGKDLLSKMESHGLTADVLPRTFGGLIDCLEAGGGGAEVKMKHSVVLKHLSSVDCSPEGNCPSQSYCEVRGSALKTGSTVSTVAHAPAEACTGDYDARAALLRKRNALYSKRKYYKKKQKIQDLMQDQYRLEAVNSDMRKENSRLEGLLVEAEKQVAVHKSLEALATAGSYSVPSAPSAIGAMFDASPSLMAPQATLSSMVAESGGGSSSHPSGPLHGLSPTQLLEVMSLLRGVPRVGGLAGLWGLCAGSGSNHAAFATLPNVLLGPTPFMETAGALNLLQHPPPGDLISSLVNDRRIASWMGQQQTTQLGALLPPGSTASNYSDTLDTSNLQTPTVHLKKGGASQPNTTSDGV